MKNSKFKKVISMILAFALVFGIASVSSFAANASPLLVMNDVNTRQGEEFEVVVKIERSITPILDHVAALDVTLSYNSEIYSVVSMENGAGLNKALSKFSTNDSNLENDYIFSTSANKPGEVKWSFVALESFTFNKGEEFMKIRFKANDLSDLNKNQNMTITVTNAAAPGTLANVTDKFAPYTNNAKVEANLTTLCDWEYVSALGGYRLVKFNGANASTFIVPAEYDDPADSKDACPVVSIGSGAFSNCETITKILIGKNVAEVGTAAFFGCSNLERIVVFSETTKFGANSLYGTSDKFVVKCIKGSEADTYAQKNSHKVEYFENVADCKYEGVDEKVYFTGNPVELSALKVYNSKNELMTLGQDYAMYYTDNVNIGTAKIIITGRGEYLGTTEVEFQVLCPYHTDDNSFYTVNLVYTDCEVEGVVIKDCSFCGYHDESEVAPAKEHGALVDVVATESTCTTEGLINHVCQDCKKVISTSPAEVKDHTDPEVETWVVLTPASCDVVGKEVRYCADCEYIIDQREIPALKHMYQEGFVKEPTCQETGIEAMICVNCGDAQYEAEVPVVDHDVQWVVTTEPTCKEAGVETKQCRFCGYHEGEAETREVPETGCKAGEWVVTKEATCEDDGVKIQACEVCGEIVAYDTIDATGHTEQWITVVEETCTTGLHKIKHCSTCNEDLDTVKTDAPGHQSGEWKTVTEYSCTQDGLKEHYCTVCNEVYETEEKKAEGHKSGEWKTVAATCAKEGAIEHYCSVCNEVYESRAISRKAHTPGSWKTIIEPSCTKVGMKHKVCLVCGEAVDTEELAAKGHSNYVTTVVTRPTYRFEGKNDISCGVCGEYIRHAYVRKLSADIDGNGKIASSDALAILQHATGLKNLTGDALLNADLDGSGSPNSGDALIVLQIATGLITV